MFQGLELMFLHVEHIFLDVELIFPIVKHKFVSCKDTNYS